MIVVSKCNCIFIRALVIYILTATTMVETALASVTTTTNTTTTITFTTTTNSTTAITLNRMLFSIKVETCVAYTCNIMSPYTCLLLLLLYYFLFFVYVESFWMLLLFNGSWLYCAHKMLCEMSDQCFMANFSRLKSYDQKWCME